VATTTITIVIGTAIGIGTGIGTETGGGVLALGAKGKREGEELPEPVMKISVEGVEPPPPPDVTAE